MTAVMTQVPVPTATMCEIDTDVVFRTLAEDIPAMISVVEKIITDLG